MDFFLLLATLSICPDPLTGCSASPSAKPPRTVNLGKNLISLLFFVTRFFDQIMVQKITKVAWNLSAS